MTNKTVTRPVERSESVEVVECDVCGKQADRVDGIYSPHGWVTAVRDGEPFHFCSMTCIQQWVSGSAEMTDIARAAFKEATGGTS